MREPSTLIDLLRRGAIEREHLPALSVKRGGERLSWSGIEFYEIARDLARGLIGLGLERGERVAMIGRNEPEWVMLQYATQIARAVPTPIFDTATDKQVAYIFRHTEARFVFIDSAHELETILRLERDGKISAVERIVSFLPVARDAAGAAADDPRLLCFDELLERGRAEGEAEVEQRLREIMPDDVCLLVYTSGTTSEPKGVQQTHRGLMAVANAGYGRFQELVGEDDYRAVSYLPLSHQAEQLFSVVFPAIFGGEVHFCPDMSEFRDLLREFEPTVFLGVPQIWEAMERGLRKEFDSLSPTKAGVVKWCRETELGAFYEYGDRSLERQLNPMRRLARKLAIDSIRRSLGFGRLRLACSGSAPISARTQEFFASIGIVIVEGYGLTETCGLVTVADHRRPRFGTVGKPLPGVEVRLSDQAEIEVRGPMNTPGYFRDEEANAALFTEDGFLRTGDLGGFDDDGNLIITGRIKEIIITAGGRNIAPIPIENMLQGILGVQHAVVVGDRKPFLSALITLDPAQLDQLIETVGLPKAPMHELVQMPKLIDWLEHRIDVEVNQNVARHQTIKRFAILPRPFAIERAELTASLKKRRGAIVSRYADTIASFYRSDAGGKSGDASRRAR